MQNQKLPLWQLFLFSCAKQRYLPPSRQPGHSAHIRSGIHGTLRSRHTALNPGNSAHAGPHGAAYGQSSPHPRTRHKTHATHAAPGSRIRLVRQSRPHRCGRLPFFPPGIPARHYPSRGSPDPPTASLLPGKPGSVPGITPFRESPAP